MKLNPNKEIVKAIKKRLKQTGGYCPCVPKNKWNDDTICPCKMKRDHDICHCKLYIDEN